MNINIEEIFTKHLEEELKNRTYNKATLLEVKKVRSYKNNPAFKAAIKEIVEAVIDKCAKEAQVEFDEGGVTEFVNEQSILNVKQMIDYGTD